MSASGNTIGSVSGSAIGVNGSRARLRQRHDGSLGRVHVLPFDQCMWRARRCAGTVRRATPVVSAAAAAPYGAARDDFFRPVAAVVVMAPDGVMGP